MTDLREAAQQALGALACPGKARTADEQDAITALRAALAEPVATFDEVWDAIDWDKWRMEPIRELVRMIHSKTNPKAALAEPTCCCGEPTASEVVHRQDGPCYMAEPGYWQEEARRYAGNADYWRERLKTQQRGCQVCGIGANGETVGYVCTRGDCPTRVTCGVAP